METYRRWNAQFGVVEMALQMRQADAHDLAACDLVAQAERE